MLEVTWIAVTKDKGTSRPDSKAPNPGKGQGSVIPAREEPAAPKGALFPGNIPGRGHTLLVWAVGEGPRGWDQPPEMGGGRRGDVCGSLLIVAQLRLGLLSCPTIRASCT